MLCDLNTLKNVLNVPLSDGTQDVRLSLMLLAAEQAILKYCKRNFETQNYTEYRNGSTVNDLFLYQRPVRMFLLTGNTTAGSPVVTGISSTTNLIAGMPCSSQYAVSGSVAVPSASVILSVDSPSQVTLNLNAYVTQTASPLVFGLTTWQDSGGAFGQGVPYGGVQPYPDTAQLFLGSDYVLQVDQPDGSSKSGLLKRMGSGSLGGGILAWPWPEAFGRGSLTAQRLPAWRALPWGSVKIVYQAGLGTGAPSPPSATNVLPASWTHYDLTMAEAEVAAWMANNSPYGGEGMITGEGYQDYNYSLAVLGKEPALGTVRRILSAYREVVI